jgi:hypothetical protein
MTMKTLYLIKEKEEIKKFAGIVCGENIEIDNDKKEVKLYTKIVEKLIPTIYIYYFYFTIFYKIQYKIF